MADPHDVSFALVQVSSDAGVTWTNIWGVTSRSATHGSENGARRRILGQVAPIVRVGDAVDTYSLSGLLDMTDTIQNALRDAKDDGTPVLVRFLPDGLGAGNPYEEQECMVTEYGDDTDAEGDFIECTFELEGSGVLDRGTLV